MKNYYTKVNAGQVQFLSRLKEVAITAKEYFKSIVDLGAYISAQEEDKQKALARATSVTQQLREESVISTHNHRKQEERAVKYTQISIDLDKEVDELLKKEQEARWVIGQLDDNRYKAVLTLRYLVGRSWEYIAEQLSYGERRVYDLHDEALLAVDALGVLEGR